MADGMRQPSKAGRSPQLYVMRGFYDGTGNNRSYGFEVLYQVAEPVSNYSQVRIGDETYRYVWWVIVQQEPKPVHAPPPGHYIMDATTGEVIYAI